MMRSNKRGIISEQLYILFGVLVVVIFTINAYNFVNGIASKAGIQQQFAVRDLAMTATTISGAPGDVVYAMYIQKSRQKIFPGQLMLAFYDPKTEDFLNYAEYFFTFSNSHKFLKDKNLTNSIHVLRVGDQFGFYNLFSEKTDPGTLDCRNYIQTRTIGELSKKKIVISLQSKEKYVEDLAEKIHAAIGGGLATGQNIILDKEGKVQEADIFLALKDEKNSSILLATSTREAKKLGCMIKEASGIKNIKQEYELSLQKNPSVIKIMIKLAPGEDPSSEIANSILRYYHE